jgi:Rne/Rng family ribonuclease
VDVNTGGDTTPAAGLKANIAAARDLPRQLRLRGLGGQIVVDFAPMPKRDRAVLDQVLRAAFKGESAETSLVGWTTLGLYELVRKRDRLALADVLGAEAQEGTA